MDCHKAGANKGNDNCNPACAVKSAGEFMTCPIIAISPGTTNFANCPVASSDGRTLFQALLLE
jgi:hypothetical protein